MTEIFLVRIPHGLEMPGDYLHGVLFNTLTNYNAVDLIKLLVPTTYIELAASALNLADKHDMFLRVKMI